MAVATYPEWPSTLPINKLVDDTLLIILDFCVLPETSMSDQETLIAFSQVCRRWRKVALECPRPWSYIRLTKKKEFKSLLDRWIERSQKHPLDVEVMESYGTVMANRQCRILDQLLTSEIARIRSLNIELYNQRNKLHCFKMGLTSPVLKSLSLNMYAAEPQRLLDFPALKVLDLHRTASPLIQHFKVPMKSLTDLTINCVGPSGNFFSRCDWLTFLKGCPQLTVFNLTVHRVPLEDNTSVKPAEPLILHNLTHLKVVLTEDYANHLTLLEDIHVPFLQYFHFEGPGTSDNRNQLQSDLLFDALLLIMKCCQETLLELSLWKIRFSVVQATVLLGYGKRIKKLDITHSSLLQALVPPFGSCPTNWLCPYLQELTAHKKCAALPDFIDLVKQRTSTMLAPCPNGFCYITQINLVRNRYYWKHLVRLKRVKKILNDKDGVVIVGLNGMVTGP